MTAGTSFSRPIVYTGVAMLAFAGNSIICRLALRDGAIDPATFTSIRLLAGAIALLLIFTVARRNTTFRSHGSWFSACTLFLYAVTFSFAYISLNAGTGALILFAFVQATMIAMGLWSGDRPSGMEWLGWLLAFAGVIWLVLPGVEAPPASGALLMALSGIAWGIYSIRGRKESDALGSTTTNFLMSVVFVIALVAMTFADADISTRGVLLAVTSGALTSGIGYVIWYAALDYLSAMQAAMVQLTVPAIAAAGGVLLLAEPVSMRLVVSSVLILGGISIAVVRKAKKA